MKYEVGDEIIIKLTQEEGRVVELLNEEMVMIEVKGVKFPAYMDQIDFPYFYRFTKKKIVAPTEVKVYVDDIKREKPKPVAKVENGIWLNMFPILSTDEFGDDVVHFYKIYIVNETKDALTFQYTLSLQNNPVFELKNELLPFHDFYVHDVAIEDFSSNPKFSFVFSLKKADKKKAEYYEVQHKLKAKKVFQQLEMMKEKGEASMRVQLLKAYPDAPEKLPQLDLDKLRNAGLKVMDAKAYKAGLPAARSVIDLHIEKLTDSYQSLSPSQIMDIQMKEFEKWYNIAVMQQASRFIVVHGIGNGILRNEIHEFLKYKSEVKRFVNQYHPNFGYGATEIYFNHS